MAKDSKPFTPPASGAKPVKSVSKPAAPVAKAPVPAASTPPAAPVAPAKPEVKRAAPKALPAAPAATTASAAPAADPVRPAPAAAPADEGTNTMQDTVTETVKTTAEQASAKATAMFGDMNARAKDAMAKGNQLVGEMNDLTKGNIEAIVESSKIAAKGAEDIARYSADYGRKTIEQANETAKRFASVKSPTELFQLQSEIAKSAVEAMVAETSKFTESYLKLLGEIAQPISNRVAVSVEKVKLAA